MQNDAELVRAVLAGRQEAYAELVRRHERALLAATGEILGDLHAAKDAAQEAFVTAYEVLRSLRKPAAFGPWVLQIARRHALKMARRQARTVPLTDASEPAWEQQDGRIDEQTQQVLSAVMKLPEKHRQVVLLRYFGPHSIAAIAEMTGQPVGTVKSQLSRASARLRERLKDMQP